MACEGDFGVTLESLFVYDGDFVATLGLLGGHFWLLWRLWGHFGITLGAFAAYRGNFGTSLASLWGQFGYLWLTLRHLMVTLQSYWSHFGHIKARVKKNTHFPTDLNDFIKLFGGLWVHLGSLWDRFWHMNVNLDPLWGHFGATLGI